MRPSTMTVGYLLAYVAAFALVGDIAVSDIGWTWG
jgi:hypothetical protein